MRQGETGILGSQHASPMTPRGIGAPWVTLSVLLPLALLGSQATQVHGMQATVDLDQFDTCRNCHIESVLEVRMGEAAGDGIIFGQLPAPVYDPQSDRYAVFARGGSEILLFTAEGDFLRKLGREGQGPGELRTIVRVGFRDGILAVMNYGNQRWTFLDTHGELLREVRYEGEIGEIIWLSLDSMLVGGMGRSRESVGFPLHMVDLSTGNVVRHFGSVNGRHDASDPFGDSPVVEQDPTKETIWIGRAVALHFEEWSLDGDLLSTVTREPAWYPRVTRAALRSGEPQTYLRDFAIDGERRLWILSHTADEEWEAAIDRDGRVIDAEKFAGTRVDVYDLERASYLGSHRFDEWEASLVVRDGEVLVNVPEIGDDLNLTLALYRLHVRRVP